MQVVFWYELALKGNEFRSYSWIETLGIIAFSAASVLFQIVLLAFLTKRLPAVAIVSSNAFIFISAILSIYHIRTSVSLDYAIFADNRKSLFYLESLEMVGGRLSEANLWLLGGLAAILISCEQKTRLLSRSLLSLPTPLPLVAVSLCSLVMHFLIPTLGINELDYFAQSVWRYHTRERGILAAMPGAQFPYVSLPSASAADLTHQSGPRPNVFVIIIESFSQSFVGHRNEAKIEYTPFFNSLIAKGIYAPRFYANATYTIKGQEAVFCSLWPTIRSDLATGYSQANVQGLPAILEKVGYTSLFLQASLHLSFANTGAFMQRVGFSRIHSTEVEKLSEVERKNVWGWGLEDSYFYKRVFDRLDSDFPSGKGTPLFVALAPVVSHAPFFVPTERRALYPNPKSRLESFANTIRLADDGLQTFFQCLDERPHLSNSIVVILGDHGMPDGSRENQEIESNAYDDAFRVPLLVVWNGRLTPRTLEHSHSQVDVAPTILDLLNVRQPNHFVGHSLLVQPEDHTINMLFQNGGGGFAVAVRDPFKYVFQLSTKREQIFDIVNDPLELTNLPMILPTRTGRELKQAVERLWIHQRLVEGNRLWPAE